MPLHLRRTASSVLFLFLIHTSSFWAPVAALLTNFTVDDAGTTSDGLHIVYEPAGAWSPGQSCDACDVHLDPSRVLNRTWHDVSYLSNDPPASPLTASLTFEGEFIIAHSPRGTLR